MKFKWVNYNGRSRKYNHWVADFKFGNLKVDVHVIQQNKKKNVFELFYHIGGDWTPVNLDYKGTAESAKRTAKKEFYDDLVETYTAIQEFIKPVGRCR